MTDRVDSEDVSGDVHRAVLTLHEVAGTYKGIGQLPGFRRPPFGEALSALANAPPEEATTGAKLDTLVALARADFPKYDEAELGYVELARAIGSPYGLDAQQVLDDAKAVGLGDDRIADTVTGQTLPHNATAFVGEDVCRIAEVIVEGIKSVWVFSEFETNAPFNHVAEWVRPQNWPKRRSAMFKGMDVVGGQVTDIPEGSFTEHWHGVFLEDVQSVRPWHCFERRGVVSGGVCVRERLACTPFHRGSDPVHDRANVVSRRHQQPNGAA